MAGLNWNFEATYILFFILFYYLFIYFEMESCSASASQSAGITGVSHRAWPLVNFSSWLFIANATREFTMFTQYGTASFWQNWEA